MAQLERIRFSIYSTRDHSSLWLEWAVKTWPNCS